MSRQETCKERLMPAFRERMTDLRQAWKAYNTNTQVGEFTPRSFNEYGHGVDYVSKGTFKDLNRGYLRYQISGGGPQEEFRFFKGGDGKLEKVEFWFLDWFDGAKTTIRRGYNFDFLKELYLYWE